MDYKPPPALRESPDRRARRRWVIRWACLAVLLPISFGSALAQSIRVSTFVQFSAPVSRPGHDATGTVYAVVTPFPYPLINPYVLINGQQHCEVVGIAPGSASPQPLPCVRQAQSLLVSPADSAIFVGGTQWLQGNFTTIPRLAKLTLPSGEISSFRLTPQASTPLPTSIAVLARLDTATVLAAGPLAANGEWVILRVDANTGAASDALIVPGSIAALEVQADGGVLVGGNFVLDVAGTPRRGLIRLQPTSLAVDQGFLSALDGPVSSITVSGDGRIYATRGNAFGAVRLAATGAIDRTWSASADGAVNASAIDAMGRVYLVGSFTTINGVQRRGLARLSPESGANVDLDWNPGSVNGVPTGIRVHDGEVVVSGAATSPSTHQAGLLRYTVDAAQPPPATNRFRIGSMQDPSGSLDVVRMAFPTPDGDLIVGGTFTMTATHVVPSMVRIDPSGQQREDWIPEFTGAARSGFGAADGAGLIYLSGYLARSGDAERRFRTIRIDGTSAVVHADWVLDHPDAVTFAYALQGPWLYGLGGYCSINGVPAALAARVGIAAPPLVDAGFSPLAPCGVLLSFFAIMPQPDGTTLLGFGSGGGISFNPPPPPGPPIRALWLLRPVAGGPGTLEGYGPWVDSNLANVRRVVTDGQGRRYLTGRFRSADDPARLGIVRMLADGATDTTLPNFTTECRPFGPATVGADGRVYLLCELPGGDQYSAERRLVRIVPETGELDRDWTISPSEFIARPSDVVSVGAQVAVVFEWQGGGELPIKYFSTAARPIFADGFEP